MSLRGMCGGETKAPGGVHDPLSSSGKPFLKWPRGLEEGFGGVHLGFWSSSPASALHVSVVCICQWGSCVAWLLPDTRHSEGFILNRVPYLSPVVAPVALWIDSTPGHLSLLALTCTCKYGVGGLSCFLDNQRGWKTVVFFFPDILQLFLMLRMKIMTLKFCFVREEIKACLLVVFICEFNP